MVVLDIAINKDRKSATRNKKTDWFYGNEEYSLKDDEYMIVADFKSMVEIRNIALKNGEQINLFGHTLKPKYDSCRDGFLEMSSNHINTGIILVPDNVIDENYLIQNQFVLNI